MERMKMKKEIFPVRINLIDLTSSGEELYDSTNLDKKEGMEPLINFAAEVKFQLFRQRKTQIKADS